MTLYPYQLVKRQGTMLSWAASVFQLHRICGRDATRNAAAGAGNSSNPLGLPGSERKLKQVELITGDRTELADVEICLKPDGSDWLLGIGASSRVRLGLCVWSCSLWTLTPTVARHPQSAVQLDAWGSCSMGFASAHAFPFPGTFQNFSPK